jgi:hypothetical protein
MNNFTAVCSSSVMHASSRATLCRQRTDGNSKTSGSKSLCACHVQGGVEKAHRARHIGYTGGRACREHSAAKFVDNIRV